MKPIRNRQSGWTMLEAIISAGVLSVLVLAAATVSKMAMSASAVVVTEDAANGRVENTLTTLRRVLLSASLSSLQAIPEKGVVLEPMQEDVAYDNLSFRTVTGFEAGERCFEPPLGVAPWSLLIETDADGVGLWYVDGRSKTKILDGVSAISFVRSGKNLSIKLATEAVKQYVCAVLDVVNVDCTDDVRLDDSIVVLDVALMVP